MPSNRKKKGGMPSSADVSSSADAAVEDPEHLAKLAASDAMANELIAEEDAAKKQEAQKANKAARKLRQAQERAAAAAAAHAPEESMPTRDLEEADAVDMGRLRAGCGTQVGPDNLALPVLSRQPSTVDVEAVTLSGLSSFTSIPGRQQRPRQGRDASSDGRSDGRSDDHSQGQSSSRTGGGRSHHSKGGTPADSNPSKPPTKKVNGKEVPTYPHWANFVYTPDQENSDNTDPRDRMLKLLNPGSPSVAINHTLHKDYHKVTRRAIDYLYHQKDARLIVRLDRAWDQEGTQWDEQTAVHFAAQCSHMGLEQLAKWWGADEVGELAARCDANGYNALHLAVCCNQSSCVRFLLRGDVGIAFRRSSDQFCKSKLEKFDFQPSGVNAFILDNVVTERQVKRETMRRDLEQSQKLNAEQRRIVRSLPAGVLSCGGIGTRTALSLAAERHHHSIVKTLLEEGADPNQHVEGQVRTKICRFFQQRGYCDNGSHCAFGHADTDLGTPRPGSTAVVPYVSAIRSCREAAIDARRAEVVLPLVESREISEGSNSSGGSGGEATPQESVAVNTVLDLLPWVGAGFALVQLRHFKPKALSLTK